MKKFFTNLFASIVFLSVLGLSAQAQNVLYEEQFDGGTNGWTIDTIFNDGVDSMSWRWTDTGNPGPVMINPNPAPNLMSPTASNGAMVFNFEYMRYGGDINNVPANPPYGEFVGEIISPTIDMSDVSGPINISYYQVGRYLNAADGYDLQCSISFSPDDGATWSAPINAFPDWEIRDVYNGEQQLPIPSNLGLQGSPTVKMKFTYSQDFYYWMIDDITIIERTEPDMRANMSFFAIAPNYATPKSQVEEFGFLVDIENIGGTTEENVNVNVRVQNGETGAVVYETDQPYGSITPDSLAENVPFGAFTPPAEAATYTTTYRVSSDGTDNNPANNVISYDFVITDTLFAKEAGEGLAGIRGTADNSWTMGNVYYIPTGGYFAKNATFGVSNAADIAGQFMTIKLLKWEGDLDGDGMANESEYSLVTFNGYTFDGTEDNQVITLPIDLDGKRIPLEEGGTYIVTMEYTDIIDQFVFFLTTTNHDYGAMVFRTDSLGANRYGALLDVGNSGDLSTGNFQGGYYVPAVRLSIADSDPTTSVTELATENIVNIFPNPTADELNINLDLIENSEKLNVRIMDISGKVHFTQQYEDIQSTTLEYDLRSYSSGSYIVYIETEDGIRSIPFAIQK